LNQRYQHPDGNKRVMEEMRIPFMKNVENFLPTFGTPLNGVSYFVVTDIKHPFHNGNLLKGNWQ